MHLASHTHPSRRSRHDLAKYFAPKHITTNLPHAPYVLTRTDGHFWWLTIRKAQLFKPIDKFLSICRMLSVPDTDELYPMGIWRQTILTAKEKVTSPKLKKAKLASANLGGQPHVTSVGRNEEESIYRHSSSKIDASHQSWYICGSDNQQTVSENWRKDRTLVFYFPLGKW